MQSYDPTKPGYKDPLVSQVVRDNFNSLDSSHSGPVAPDNPVEGKQWYDTTNRRLMRYVSGSWILEMQFTTAGAQEVDGGELT